MSTNYELALKLKKTGFPQKKGVDAKEILKKGHAPVYLCKHGNINCPRVEGSAYNCSTSCYIPTLSELIEACGEKFGYLSQWENGNEKGNWQSISRDGIVIVWGSTPEEAVANLWLELNKK